MVRAPSAFGELPAELREWLEGRLGAPVQPRAELVAVLWGGHGFLLRVFSARGDSVIVKRIRVPRVGRNESEDRKARSYEVERAFYEDFASALPQSARVARYLGAEVTRQETWLLLEDLGCTGFVERRGQLESGEIRACLDWLASFHAHFLGAEPARLWPVGTYWHLGTRRRELQAIGSHPLARLARGIDERLTRARHQTFVHGDAKPDNFLFAPSAAAAVDFQYVGRGVGVKDLAYFASSVIVEARITSELPALVDEYFVRLGRTIRGTTGRLGDREALAQAVEVEWRALFPLAWLDFARFWLGWCPGGGSGVGLGELDPYSARLVEELRSNADFIDAGFPV